jgi:hypothetical protein
MSRFLFEFIELNNRIQSTCNNHNKGSLEIPSSVDDNENSSHYKLPFNSDLEEKFNNSEPNNAIISINHDNSITNSQDFPDLKIKNNGQTNDSVDMKSLENNIAERINFLTRSSSKIRLKKRNKYKAKKVKKNRKAYSKKRMKASSSKSIVRNVKKRVIQNPIHNSNNLSNKTVVNPIDQIIINEMKRKISLQSNLTLNRNSTMLRIQPNISNIISVNKTISQQRINNTTQLIQNARVQNAKNNVNKVVSNSTLVATKRNITVNNKNLAVSTNLSKLTTSNTTLQKRNGTNPQVQNFIDPKTKKVVIIHKALLPSANILNKGKTITNNRDQYISVLRSLQAKDHLKQMSQVNTPVQKNQINNKLLMKNTTLLQVKSILA